MSDDVRQYVLIAIKYGIVEDFKVHQSNDLSFLINKAQDLQAHGYISNIIDTVTEENVVVFG
jgi:hypothetical protein